MNEELRREAREMLEDILDEIGEEGVEAAAAGAELVYKMDALGCDDEDFERALRAMVRVVEGESGEETIHCGNGARVTIHRTWDGVRVETEPEVPDS